jgi:hypothetical protein
MRKATDEGSPLVAKALLVFALINLTFLIVEALIQVFGVMLPLAPGG